MMASTIVTAFLGIAVLLAFTFGEAVDKQKLREKAMALISDCQKQVGASDADVQALNEKKMPATHEGLCLLECVFNSANMMKDGKLNKEGAIKALTPAMGGDADKIEKMKAMMEKCDKEVVNGDGDKCQTAKMFVDCTMKYGPEFGFEFPTSA